MDAETSVWVGVKNMAYKIKRPIPPYYIPLSDKIEKHLDNEWNRGQKGKEEVERRLDTDAKEPYWKVKDTVENLFFNQKFETSFKAHQFANLENGGRYPPRYVVIRFSPKGAGKGWRENPDASGKAPIHKAVAERAQAKHAQNTPMKRNKPSKLVIQNINSDPIQKDTIALSGTTNVTSPQNFQPIKQLTLGNTLYLYYDQPFRVVKEKGSIEILPESSKGHFIMIEDRMGNITLSHSGSRRVAFFQAEADKEFIIDLLKKAEKEDMENGYDVKINDSEPRASALSELWEASEAN